MAFVLQFYCSYGVHKSECRGLKGQNRLKKLFDTPIFTLVLHSSRLQPRSDGASSDTELFENNRSTICF